MRVWSTPNSFAFDVVKPGADQHCEWYKPWGQVSLDEQATWLRVLTAVKELLATEPWPEKTVH